MSTEGESPVVVSGGNQEAPPQPGWQRWTRALGFAFVALVVLALVGLLAFGLLSDDESGTAALSMNRQAPDFTLNLFDGGTFTLSEQQGKPVVVNIWASWCPSCREEAPVLEEGWRAYQDQGVVFVGVNVMDSRSDAEAFLEEFDITYPNGPDESNIYTKYGATGVPETFFINREGVIVQKFMGPLKADQLSIFVEELLK
jgi:cytochrome c biogenesis protein CcmG/thiol:disulfide interchange protein DsbE